MLMRHRGIRCWKSGRRVFHAAQFVSLSLVIGACEAPTCAPGLSSLDGSRCGVEPPYDAAIDPRDASPPDDASAPATDASVPMTPEPDAGGPADAGVDAQAPCGLITFYEDRDGDGHGAPTRRVDACSAPPGYVKRGDDCDDGCSDCKPGGSGMCLATSADFSCVTRCGSVGMGTCTSSCELNCVAPEEVCNYADDDCDGMADEELRKLSVSPFREQASVRTWLFAQGSQPVAFIQLPPSPDDGRSELRMRRLNADATPVDGDVAVMNVALASAEYALTALGDDIAVVWGETDEFDPTRVALRARVLGRTDLSDVVAPRTLTTTTSLRHPNVAASPDGLLIVYSDDATVARVATDRRLEKVGPVQPFAGSLPARTHAIYENSTRSFLVAYPSAESAGAADLFLQAIARDGATLGAALNASSSRASDTTSPWLARDGAGTIALTFHESDGGLKLLLLRMAGLEEGQLKPIANLTVSPTPLTCALEACRSSSVAWTSGFWTVLFAIEDDPTAQTLQARMFGARGALTSSGSAAMSVVKAASGMLAPQAAPLNSGVTVIAASAGASTRYARWGCF